ncbi:MAG: DUF2007 domain-containing protein [Dehalococcoidia bacterium]
MKWELLATAPDSLIAEMWCETLREEGITAVIDPRDNVSFLGVSLLPCRVMVSEDMIERAREVLLDCVGGMEGLGGDHSE